MTITDDRRIYDASGDVPIDRVKTYAGWTVCRAGCKHRNCDIVRLAREVLGHRRDVAELTGELK